MSHVTIYFVRHGESVANLSDRNGAKRPEDADRLSELGWEQARGLGRRLQDEGLELVVASPMTRAQETAEGIAEVLELPVETDGDLFEVRQSDAFYAASPIRRPRLAELDADRRPGPRRAGRRVLQRDRRPRAPRDDAARRLASERRIVAVSHHSFLHFFLGVTLFGDDFTPSQMRGLYMAGHANTGITIFERVSERWMDGVDLPGWILTTWNDRSHL